jgi:hypothetical protein
MHQESAERGKREASNDIAAHRPRLFWATRGSWGQLLCEIMKSRFGIEVEHIDCFTSDEKESFEAAYNETVIAYIDATFGERSYEQALEEVTRFRDEQYKRSASADDLL